MTPPSLRDSSTSPRSGASAPPAAAPRFVQLPTDTERSADSGFEAATSAWVRLDVSPSLGRAPQAELLGALFALLNRYTQQTTLAVDVFGAKNAGGTRVPLDLDVTGESPVSSVIAGTKLALSKGSAAPGAAISNVAATLLFGSEVDDSRDVGASVLSAPSGYEVHFVVARNDEAVFAGLAYNAALLRSSTAGRLIESYIVLLAAALRDPNTSVDRVPILRANETRALTAGQDSGHASYPAVPVQCLFAALATKQPASIAASIHDRSIRYAELDERSSQLAHYLVARGVEADVPVAVCVRPSLDVLVAMLAIWKARGIYLPLDPTHPEALIGRMLDEAKPRLVLTTSELSPLTVRFSQFCFDWDAADLDSLPKSAPPTDPNLSDAAYLFYTSGTTGKAKGVVATQGNLAHYIHAAAQKYGFGATDVFASLARYTFSISLFEILSPLCCGGSLRILERDEVLTPERLCRALEEVTVLHAGPSLLGSLFRYLRTAPAAPHSLPRMRHASSGGDMVSPSVMEEMKRVFPNAEIFVIYGCTEISCMGTTFAIPRQAKVSRTFVGKPFPDVTLRVLDTNRNLVPFGVVGEICFAGKGIVRGYLDRPELTAEKFVEMDGRRFYQTGDMGRLHSDGNLEILGRRDFQIQLRGIRIELAGIEKTVQDLGLAPQCAIVAKTLDEGDVRLVAFVVKPRDDRVAAFRRALAAELPDYMLPHHVVVLDAMPLTANGKLDRNRLKEMPWEKQLRSNDRTPPANEREQKIADVFAHVLGLGEVGVEDSFFDLGGDSLLGVAALEEIDRAIGAAIPPQALFESGTVRALATYTERGGAGQSRPILLNAKSDGPPLFMLSGIHLYRPLAQRLAGRCSAYGVFARREVTAFDPVSGFHSVEDLARDYVEMIRSQQPKGPYRLLGYSFAGLVAYEVAHQLRASREDVGFLVLVDSALPEWTEGWRFRLSQLARLRSAPRRDVVAFAWRRLRGRPPREEFMRYQEDSRLGPLEQQRETLNRAAAAQYMTRIRPLAGNVLVFVAGDRLRTDPLKSPSCGWAPYVPSLHVHTIHADHFRMITDDPFVSEMADVLAGQMQRTEP